MAENFDILGFNPADLNVYKENTTLSTTTQPSNIYYHTRPKDSVSEDGYYRSTIKVIYNPFNFNDSFVEQQSYAIHDSQGWMTVVSKLTNEDKTCPIFSAWKQCRYSQDQELKHISESKANGGPGYFDKRFARYVTIQVIEDKNQPDLEGKYMLWKLPQDIFTKINAKQKPADTKKASIPVMDFLFGRAIELEVAPGPKDPTKPERETREISYSTSEISDDIVSCVRPDGSSFLSSEEQDILDTYVSMMKKVWKEKEPAVRETLLAEVNSQENTKKLSAIYNRVLDEIKSPNTQCPNVREKAGYSEWSEQTKKRVDDYLKVVLAKQDPTTTIPGFMGVQPLVKTQVESNTTTPSENVSVETKSESVNENPFPQSFGGDDLPF